MDRLFPTSMLSYACLTGHGISVRFAGLLWLCSAFLLGCDSGGPSSDCVLRMDCSTDLRSEYSEASWGPGDVLAVRRVPRNSDGTLKEDSAGIYLRRLDGSVEWPLVLDADLGDAAHTPVWSPDGQAIAFEAGYDIYTVPSAGGLPRRITSGPRQKALPSWSPDGRELLFQVALGWVPDRGIWVVRADGTGEHQLRVPADDVRCLGCPPTAAPLLDTYGPGVQWHVRSPVWLSDGRRIAYAAFENVEGTDHVAVYDTTSAAVEFAFRHRPGLGSLRASPDGNRIAFVGSGGDDKPFRLGVLDLRSGTVEWVTDWGTWPAWSPDGTHLIYRTDEYPDIGRPGNRDLWTIDVRSGERRQVTFATGRPSA